MDRAILVLATVTIVLVAGIVAVGAAVVLSFLVTVGVIVATVKAANAKVRR